MPRTSNKKKSICTYVHDGDTVYAENTDRIRLANVHAPELGKRGCIKAKRILSKRVALQFLHLALSRCCPAKSATHPSLSHQRSIR